jgi:hypothetical protein
MFSILLSMLITLKSCHRLTVLNHSVFVSSETKLDFDQFLALLSSWLYLGVSAFIPEPRDWGPPITNRQVCVLAIDFTRARQCGSTKRHVSSPNLADNGSDEDLETRI